MAPQWAAFLGLTGFVLLAMLVLARLSQQALEREPGPDTSPVGWDPPAVDPDATSEAEPMLEEGPRPEPEPRFEEELRPEPDPTAEEVPPADTEPAPDEGSTSDGEPVPVPGLDPGSDDSAPEPTARVAGDVRPSPRDSRRPALQDLSPAALLANVALTHGLFAGALVVGAWYFGIPAAAFGVAGTAASTGLPAVGLGLAFGLALWVANEGSARLADAMGVGYDESLRELLGPDTRSGWALLLGGVLPIIAVGEEIMFRGALVGVPAAAFGTSPWLLAVASSVAFALGHGAQGRAGILVTGLLGFVLAAAFVLTGSLLLVIVAHYVVNAMEFVVHEGVDPDWLPDRAPE